MRLLLPLLVLSVLAADEFRTVAPGIILSLPDGWTQTKSADGGSLVLRSPLAGNSSAQASVAISVEPFRAGRDSQMLIDETLATLRRLAPEFAVIDVPVAVEIAGRSWRRASYRFATGELVWMQQVLAVSDAKGAACITCSSEREHFATWLPVFSKILAGLEHQSSRLAP